MKRKTNSYFLSLILLLSLVAFSGCSMIFGKKKPEDEPLKTHTENGVSYDVPESYVSTTKVLSNNTQASVWTNDPEELDIAFTLTTLSANDISLKDFNWIATGYFSGKVTFMGQTVTVSPSVQNPKVIASEDVTINGNAGYKTKVTYDYTGFKEPFNVTETVYTFQIDDTIIYMIFSNKSTVYSDYKLLIDKIVESVKLV
ncbi:MAG: hypothetical protein IJD02_01490 [Lachnospiraceae bacterium]|nr:hypothetical protein [Lachnospiraceae bacterium]